MEFVVQFGKKKKMKSLMICKWFFVIGLTLGFQCSFAQIGGDNTFAFLGLSSSARIMALGGTQNAILDDDILLAPANPAVLNSSMHQSIGFAHSFYHSQIGYGTVAYGHNIDSSYTLMGGVQYINYGDFAGYDVIGNSTNTFSAGEIAVFVGLSKRLYERLNIGASLRYINSSLDSYSSSGIATDFGLLFHDDEKLLSVGFVVKNAGFQLSNYAGTKERLPLDVQLGLTKRLEHLPFRFGLLFHHLNNWDLRYDDPNVEDLGILFGEENASSERSSFLGNAARHMIISGEFLLGKNESFNIRFAYHLQRRNELNLSTFRSLSGFSGGFGLRVNRFHIDYGMSIFHVAGTAHQLSISSNIGRFTKDRVL